MNLFYEPNLEPNINEIYLNEEESKHAVKVLRLKTGDAIHLINGNGYLFEGHLVDTQKRSCLVKIERSLFKKRPFPHIHLAISPLKNRTRLEWLVEKATELGVNRITWVNCEHTERHKLRMDRLSHIMVSALKQSLRFYSVTIDEPVEFEDLFKGELANYQSQRLIAHCTGEPKTPISEIPASPEYKILIGPEGDFTKNEIIFALENDFKPVSLGDFRLRTETAALMSISLLQFKQ